VINLDGEQVYATYYLDEVIRHVELCKIDHYQVVFIPIKITK